MITDGNIISVLNCPCTIADNKKYEEIIRKTISNKKSLITIAINARKIELYNNNPEFRMIFKQTNVLPIPDGIGATIPMLLFNKKKSKKIDFPGFMLKFCDKNNIKCYFLGANEFSNERAVKQIKKTYPGIKISGRHSGFNIDEDKLLDDWVKSETQVVFVAMGSPKQELLSARLAQKKIGIIFVGVGGRFDILAKVKKRAPKLLIFLGLELPYRFISEPSRIKQQKNDYLSYLSIFVKRLF